MSPRFGERAHEQLVRGLERRVLREHAPQDVDARLRVARLVVEVREPQAGVDEACTKVLAVAWRASAS